MNASDCKPGCEQHEEYYSVAIGQHRVQYDYRAPDGTLYSTVAQSLEQARELRRIWEANRRAATFAKK